MPRPRKQRVVELAVARDESIVTSEGSVGGIEMQLRVEEVSSLIPEFSPGMPGSLAAAEWCDIVDGVQRIYNLSDQRTMLYASLRLKNAARFWYQTVQHQIIQWSELKRLLIEHFPSPIDEASVHRQLHSRKRKSTEPVESYFYEVSALAQRAKLSKRCTINYIITGLGDRNLINILTAANCDNLVDLLNRIKQYEVLQDHEKDRGEMDRSVRNQPQSQTSLTRRQTDIQSTIRQRRDARMPAYKFSGKCFHCGKVGHRAVECFSRRPKPIMNRQESTNNRINDRKVHTLSIEKNELLKTIDIEGKKIIAFIDLGSECCTIRKRDCEENRWKYKANNTVLKGFAGGRCSAIGSLHKKISVGDVQATTEFLVVPDQTQDVPIIIGQTLLHQPGVKIIKSFGRLDILKDATSTNEDSEHQPTIMISRQESSNNL